MRKLKYKGRGWPRVLLMELKKMQGLLALMITVNTIWSDDTLFFSTASSLGGQLFLSCYSKEINRNVSLCFIPGFQPETG